MSDNQQLVVAQQQQQRSVGELLVLGTGVAVISLGVAWVLKEMFPDSMPS